MTRACLALLAGMYSQQLGEFSLHSDLLPGILFAGGLVIFLRPGCWPLWLFLGASLFTHSVQGVVESRLDPLIAGDSLLVTVKVEDFPVRNDTSVSFFAVPVDAPRLPQRLRVSWLAPPVAIHAGDVWRLELRLRRPRSASNPGTADFEAWLTRERVGALGYVVSGRRNHLVASGQSGALLRLRASFIERVSSLLDDPRQAAVLAALVVGARHLLSGDQWDRYARTGTSHLMAISGLHIGLAAAGGYLLVRVLGVLLLGRGHQHHIAVVVGIVVAIAYALISGLAVPSLRAGLMLLLVGMTVLCRRRPEMPIVVSTAAMLVAVSDPLGTLSAGFKLSFTAVVILLWYSRQLATQRVTSAVSTAGLLLRTRQLATVQVLLLMGLLPVVVVSFARIAFAAPLTNFVAVPVFSTVTVPLALTGLVLDGPLSTVGDWSLRIAGQSIGLIEWLIERAAAAQWLTVTIPAISGVAWLYLLLPALWAIVPPGVPGRRIAWLALLALVLYTPARPPPGCVLVHTLDVGQGLAAVIETESHVVVYDAGPAYRSGRNSADTVILPFLASRRLHRIDRLIVSHSDLDHAGGAASLVSALEVNEVLIGERVALPGAMLRRCRAGTAWRYDGVDFRILHPTGADDVAGNEASCVLLVGAGTERMLFPGDIEERGEAALLQGERLPPLRAIIVPHHGSSTSSSPAFVTATGPDIAIAAAGFANRWGFPREDVVARWQSVGARVLTTAESGAVSLQLCADDSRLNIRRHRVTRHRIWQE